tara:strand:+ start:230 stop:475 length:246 start_codon:yes stop_codon:yes gene_type:complete
MKKITIPAEAFVNQPEVKTNFTKIVEALKDNPDGLMSHELYKLTKADNRRIREILQMLKADGKVNDSKVCRCGRTPIYIYK